MKQVVLPDDKNADKDIVVFLDEAQAAGTSEEAQERGAVAALARVAGNRNMQRVLPQAFQAAWTWCVQQVSKPYVKVNMLSLSPPSFPVDDLRRDNASFCILCWLSPADRARCQRRDAVCDSSLPSNFGFAVLKQCT